HLVRGLAAARGAMERLRPHLMIIDVDDDDGRMIELISESEVDGRVPIIALTRRADLRRQLDAFERGADDCVGVPFVPADLAARVHAVLRRAYGKTAPAFRELRLGDLEIDLVARQVRAAGSSLHLTSLEQALLYLLASNAGTVLSREVILDAIWGTDFLADSNIVDRHVRALRVKLQNDWRKPKYIETVPGVGYRFQAGSKPASDTSPSSRQ
ncbi:MAG TPA: response regulator transcription factor, partial [Candidatus Limnocylindria bacterium]|nr:response regulator transcription factor [Candidatus Limnocylindria bacterium]